MTGHEASTAPGVSVKATDSRPAPLAALPDRENPAIIDARKTFTITLISTVLFVGAVLVFIL